MGLTSSATFLHAAVSGCADSVPLSLGVFRSDKPAEARNTVADHTGCGTASIGRPGKDARLFIQGNDVQTIFSTRRVHPRDRFDCWHSVACKNLVDHNSRPKSRSGFEAEIETGSLGSVGLVLFENSPMQVSHTSLQVARLKSDVVFICRQMKGAVFIEQDERSASLEAGDLTLLDPRLPYQATFGANSKSLILKAQRRDLEARIGKTRAAAVHLIRPVGVEHALTSSMAAMLPSLAANMDFSVTGEVVANHALDLIAISVAKTVQAVGKVRVSDCKALVLSSIRAAIEARLAHPGLDTASVAGAAGVSVRYANAVLAEQDTSIMRLIQARRLARCRDAFEDPFQAHRMISEIAYGWGFTDMTHFGRRFNKAYGMSPSEYRRSHSSKTLRVTPTASSATGDDRETD